MIRKRAFTLIELLVVIAIIAILAAILFPVFAQAKLAAKTAASLSNMKQIGIGNQLYYADYDDNRMGRQSDDPSLCASWKQISDSYRKSTDIFVDPVNVAAKYYDGFSDPAVRIGLCGTVKAPLNGLKQFRRGYYWNNIFGLRSGNNGYWDDMGFNLSGVESPASVGDIVEGRGAFTDTGPFAQGWDDNVDSATTWLGSAAPVTGLVGSNLNGKYADKAENVAYLDSHAKRTSFASKCGAWYAFPATPTLSPTIAQVTDTKYKTFWNFSMDDITGLGSGYSWLVGAVEQYCGSMPAKHR